MNVNTRPIQLQQQQPHRIIVKTNAKKGVSTGKVVGAGLLAGAIAAPIAFGVTAAAESGREEEEYENGNGGYENGNGGYGGYGNGNGGQEAAQP